MLLFGYVDFVILGILILLNIKFYGKVGVTLGCWIGVLLFGLLLPFISMSVELGIVQANGGWVDSFEVLYTYLRFPTYWVLGIVQCIIFGMSANKKNELN